MRASLVAEYLNWPSGFNRTFTFLSLDNALPSSKFKCRPTPRVGSSFANFTACAASGIFAINVALVSMPLVWAWAMARFTPVQSPKSSAFIIIFAVIAG